MSAECADHHKILKIRLLLYQVVPGQGLNRSLKPTTYIQKCCNHCRDYDYSVDLYRIGVWCTQSLGQSFVQTAHSTHGCLRSAYLFWLVGGARFGAVAKRGHKKTTTFTCPQLRNCAMCNPDEDGSDDGKSYVAQLRFKEGSNERVEQVCLGAQCTEPRQHSLPSSRKHSKSAVL